MPYTLNANQCPVPPCASAVHDPATAGPITAKALAAADIGALRTKFNENAGRLDCGSRWGGGGYAVACGLDISAGAGLTLNVAAGQAVIDGVVTVAATTVALTDNIARIYIWLSRTGALTTVNNSLTPPAGAYCFLGSAVTSGGAITSVDQSGIMCIRGGTLWRRTADTTTPTDTPPAMLQFFNRGAARIWWWDGTQYWEMSSGATMTPLGLDSGGTGATGQLVLQPSGNVVLTATQAGYSNIELRSGGGVAARFTVTFPSGMTAGREWVIANTTGQPCTLVGPDGSEIWFVNNHRKKIYWDGTSIRESARALPSHFNKVITNPTYTFSTWDEVDADYIEFTPSGGTVTVGWPNGGSLGKRGRSQIVKDDHTSQWVAVKTNGAGGDKTAYLLPGETQAFVIDDSGAIVLAATRPYTRRVAIAMPDSDYTVVHPDFLAVILDVSGTLTAGRNLILPTVTDKMWCVVNGTGQTLTVKTAAGTGINLLNNKSQWFFCDGTSIRPMGGPS